MKYIFGFLDKWLSVFFLIIIIVFFWGISKCSNGDSSIVEQKKTELPLINSDGSINIKINESFQHSESGLVIGFDNGSTTGVTFNVSEPNSSATIEILFIGNSFEFENKNKGKFKCTLLSFNEELEFAKVSILPIVEPDDYDFSIKTNSNESIGVVRDDESFLDNKFDTGLKITNLRIYLENQYIEGDFHRPDWIFNGTTTIFGEGYSEDYQQKFTYINEKKLYQNDYFRYNYKEFDYTFQIIKFLKYDLYSNEDKEFYLLDIDGEKVKLSYTKDLVVCKLSRKKNKKVKHANENDKFAPGKPIDW